MCFFFFSFVLIFFAQKHSSMSTLKILIWKASSLFWTLSYNCKNIFQCTMHYSTHTRPFTSKWNALLHVVDVRPAFFFLVGNISYLNRNNWYKNRLVHFNWSPYSLFPFQTVDEKSMWTLWIYISLCIKWLNMWYDLQQSLLKQQQQKRYVVMSLWGNCENNENVCDYILRQHKPPSNIPLCSINIQYNNVLCNLSILFVYWCDIVEDQITLWPIYAEEVFTYFFFYKTVLYDWLGAIT